MISLSSQKNSPKASAIVFVMLLGTVSLFSDMVYEGARSIIGPYFALLGASGAVVGFVAGFGELIGNALRIISGWLLDKTQKYWVFTYIGYACLFAIPLLAVTHNWVIAAAFIIIERIGKAIRTPARDAMLSYAAQKMGRGFGFGLHQLMDQAGGMLGPFLMTMILLAHESYSLGFSLLFMPAMLTFIFLIAGQKNYPNPQHLETEQSDIDAGRIPAQFWIFLIGAGLMAAGYADFPLIAFHFEKANMMSAIWIPVFYMLAMLVSAASALLFGRWYDRHGSISLIVAVLFSALFALFVFQNNAMMALIGMAMWGIGLGAQKSLLKAIIGDMIAKPFRASAYGIFNTGYGVAWFLGSWLMGVLYDHAVHGLMVFSVVAILAAIPLIHLSRITRSQSLIRPHHRRRDKNQ